MGENGEIAYIDILALYFGEEFDQEEQVVGY